MKKFLFFLSFAFLSSCAGRYAVKRDFDYSTIRKVAIARFASSEGSESAGDAVRDFFSKCFIENGIDVIDSSVFDKLVSQGNPKSPQMYAQIGSLAGADAILDGSIYRYVPEKEERIYYTSSDGKIGYETSFYNAKVAITARLISTRTGEILWVNSDYYESFDIRNAMEGAVYTVFRPLKEILRKSY
ncbi:MAG: hypothetical protein J7L54_03085 [Elusimicrobia bacterium]|nr:hypothetical protein [Elusimicrobiota bacterium]